MAWAGPRVVSVRRTRLRGNAENLVSSYGVKITTGNRYVGSFIGDADSRIEIIGKQVDILSNCVKMSEGTHSDPHPNPDRNNQVSGSPVEFLRGVFEKIEEIIASTADEDAKCRRVNLVTTEHYGLQNFKCPTIRFTCLLFYISANNVLFVFLRRLSMLEVCKECDSQQGLPCVLGVVL